VEGGYLPRLKQARRIRFGRAPGSALLLLAAVAPRPGCAPAIGIVLAELNAARLARGAVAAGLEPAPPFDGVHVFNAR